MNAPLPPSAVMPEASARPPPHISDHELLCRIGRGSYGEVWLARNIMGRFRAVKVIYRDEFSEERPFQREFAGIQRFEPISRLHESQVDILHVGSAPNCFYYVMEVGDDVASGQQIDPARYQPRTLRSEIQRRGKLPVEECLEIALSLTTALEHLHSHDLVHRDIKPSNIIFVEGTPKLADIGLVTGTDASRSYVGTEGYIPPEGPGTPQADLYSLGKVLYELSTGKDRQEFPEPPTFWEAGAGQGAWLEFHEVLLRACETDPRRRYQSAAEMRADLEVLRAGKSVRRLRAVERRLTLLTRFGLVASALLVVASSAYFFSVHETRQAKMQAQRADQEAAHAKRAEQQARERLWDSYLAQAQARRLSGWAGRRFDGLEALKKAGAMERAGESLLQLRNEAIACLALADLQTAKEWNGVPSDAPLVTFDPALERYAYATDKGDVSIRSVPDGRELVHLPGDGVPAEAGLAFSPDGQLLALFHGTQNLDLTVWQLEPLAGLLKTTGINGRCFDFSADSHALALVQHDGPILLYDLTIGQWTNRLEQGPLPYMVAFSPDGRRLAVSVDNLAQVRDLQSGSVLQSFEHPNYVAGLAWHPRENLLATGCGDQKVRVWDAAAGTLRCVLAGHQSTVVVVAFSHRGDLLVSAGYDMTTRLWDTLNWHLAVTKLGIGFTSRTPFTLDDNSFGYGYSGIKLGICNVAPGRECRQFWLDPKLTERTDAFDFSPDGRHLLSAHTDGARVWDPTTGRVMTLLPDTNVACAAFALQGSLILTSGDSGLRKWHTEAAEPGLFRCGPPSPVAGQLLPRGPFSLAWDGRALATSSNYALLLFDTATGQPRFRLAQDAKFYRCALSADGRWLAGATLPQTFVRVWDLDHTNLFHDLQCRWVSSLAFSPDGQRLITGSQYEYRAWDVPSWQCAFVSPRSGTAANSRIVFAPDGRMIAVTDSTFAVRLLDTATGHELATFGMPEPQAILSLAFSPDGSQLAVGGATPVIYLWDLRLIRQELAAMKLDWD